MRFQSTLRLRALLGTLTATALLAGVPAIAEEQSQPAAAAAESAAPAAAVPAAEPAPAQSPPPTPARTPAPAEQPPATKESFTAQGGLTAAEVERAFKRYRKQVRDGDTVYCRNEKPVGTRIGKQICYSEGQVIATARAERDARDQMSQMNVCGAGSCSPGQ